MGEAQGEFERQVERLVRSGYPQAAGLTEAAFRAHLSPLRGLVPDASPADGVLPFAIVVTRTLVAPVDAMERVEREGRRGFVNLYPIDPERFVPVPSLAIPDAPAYLLLGIERGDDTRNVAPNAAWDAITARGRSPLTVEEGIAVLTQASGFLRRNYGFSLLGSRCGDRRVPALWLSGGQPRLGWCWEGNPHTWLGSASCSGRLAAQA